MIPAYRHSDFNTFEACPFAYGSNLLHRHGDTDAMRAHAPVGGDWIAEHCGTVPIQTLNYVTELGTQFHRFAYAYGEHLRRENRRSDWARAEVMARGFACIDGDYNHRLYTVMRSWWEQWEYDPTEEGEEPAYTPLVHGSFESGQQCIMQAPGGQFRYVWHPDYARLSRNGKRLQVFDWKSGLRKVELDQRHPDPQLYRYLVGFTKLVPTIRMADLQLWFVNPDHPRCGDPVTWEVDLAEGADEECITGPVEAIRNTPEFSTNPGCWLCAFCDWVAHCPSGEAVTMLCRTEPEDVQQALAQVDESERLSNMLNSRRRVLREFCEKHVAQHGPVMLGVDETGQPLAYGPRQELSVRVKVAALIAEAHAKGQDVSPYLGIKDSHALAQAQGLSDPFADDDTALECIRLTLKTIYDVHPAGEPDDVLPETEEPEHALTATERRKRLSELNRKPRKPLTAMTVTIPRALTDAEKELAF